MHLIVGRVVRPHGIRGEVIVDVRTDDPEARFAVGTALATSLDSETPPGTAAPEGAAVPGAGSARPGAGGTDGPGTPPAGDGSPGGTRWTVPSELTVEEVRAHQGRLIVSFDGVHDRNLAEELRGVHLWVDSATVAAPTDPDEFHDHQLVGLTAVDPAGEVLGEVTRIDHAPASDLLVLRRPEGGTALVPFVRAIVPEVDLPSGRVVIDPPAGLLDL